MKRAITYIGMCYFSLTHYYTQNKRIFNLPNTEKRPYHFGFIVGFNSSSFYIDRNIDPTFKDSLISIDLVPASAFIAGPIFSLNLNKNIKIRTGINYSMQDRIVNYTFLINNETTYYKKKVFSHYMEVPIQLKLKTNRINNYATYALIGYKTGYIPTQNKSRISNDFTDPLLISKWNLAYQVGGGFDFYLPYFKLGIYLGLDVGLNDILIHNNTYFSRPIKKMRTQMWQFHFTFEMSK